MAQHNPNLFLPPSTLADRMLPTPFMKEAVPQSDAGYSAEVTAALEAHAITTINQENDLLLQGVNPKDLALMGQTIQTVELARETVTDPLTGLLNRKGGKLAFERMINSGMKKFIVFMADGDNFGTINKDHGHDTGDEVIVHLGQETPAKVGEILDELLGSVPEEEEELEEDIDAYTDLEKDLIAHTAQEVVAGVVANIRTGLTTPIDVEERRADPEAKRSFPSFIIYRLGGDELVIVVDATDIQDTQALINKLQGSLKQLAPYVNSETGLTIPISISSEGVVGNAEDNLPLEHYRKLADTPLGEEKNRRKEQKARELRSQYLARLPGDIRPALLELFKGLPPEK